jgi:hypothetical protein
VKLLSLTDRGASLGREIGARLGQPPPSIASLSAADQRALRDILRRGAERASS